MDISGELSGKSDETLGISCGGIIPIQGENDTLDFCMRKKTETNTSGTETQLLRVKQVSKASYSWSKPLIKCGII